MAVQTRTPAITDTGHVEFVVDVAPVTRTALTLTWSPRELRLDIAGSEDGPVVLEPPGRFTFGPVVDAVYNNHVLTVTAALVGR